MDRINETVGGFEERSLTQFTESLTNMRQHFKQNGLDYMKDLKDIMESDEYFNEYLGQLTEDYNEQTVLTESERAGEDSLTALMEADNAAKFMQLAKNTRQEVLNESMSANLKPIVGFTLPLLKTHWINNKLKNVIRTEVPTKHVFMKSLEQRYIQDSTGKKYFYNEMIENMGTIRESIKAKVDDAFQSVPLFDFNLIDATGGQRPADVLSITTHIKAVKMMVPAADGVSADEEVIVDNIKIKPSADMSTATGEVMYTVELTDGSNTSIDVEDRVNMRIVHDTGDVEVTSVRGKVTAVQFGGHLSAENNLRSAQVGFERKDKTFSVEEITPLNTGITEDYLRDHKSMYSEDGVSRVIKTMTDVLEQMKDVDILAELDSSFNRIKNGDSGFEIPFDCTPPANYAGTPIEYRKAMIMDKLHKIGIAMGEVLKTEDMYITCLGHPQDVYLFQDVDWSYQRDANRGGIKLNHGFGLVNTGGMRYAMTSSHRVKPGTLRMYLVPTDNNHMTYTHFEFSNVISNEYRNPINGNIPNIMVGSRYTTEELQPVQSNMSISGNSLT